MRVRTPGGTYEWELERGEGDLMLRAPDGRRWTAAGADWTAALLALREQLEPEGILLCCDGARRDVHSSGMVRDWSGGEDAYALRRGRRPDMRPLVDVFGPADCAAVGMAAALRRGWRTRSPPHWLGGR
ncbi:hypothetical protein Daura_28955 [Dactylosporangium aurantiacum]|uniref:Uncharacterized protein n=1 Tax=Dactylosporangium aurantiacum TaxID=35754 RepID=A0A9Q9I7P1_9ACTN|nr:hypothetical protein [Dactylosporangium aurantiacum]MDG6106683.1 hypothetical protein [Dactylosporangium aurantiacum]UWZ50837.1 hypothetical protein Daura_28955 [Dactylosporangium aurantiacum]